MVLWSKRNPKVATLSLLVYVLFAVVAVGSALFSFKIGSALSQANASLVSNCLTSAQSYANETRKSDALPWLAEAVRVADSAGLLSDPVKTRLASLIRQVAKPTRIWAAEGPVSEAITSPSGRLAGIASGNFVEIRDIQADDITGSPMQHGAAVLRLTFSPDERRVATVDAEGVLRVWSLDSGTVLHSIKAAEEAVRFLAFGPDGQTVATASGQFARVWSTETGFAVTPPLEHDDQINQIAFRPKGTMLAVAIGGADRGYFGSVQLWDISQTDPRPISLPHGDDANAIAFNSDGRFLVTGSYDKTVQLWDLADPDHPCVDKWYLEGPVGNVAISSDGRRIAATTQDLLHLLERGSKQFSNPLKHARNLTDVRFSPDNRKVATACDDATVLVWDFKERVQSLPALVHNAKINTIVFSPDNRHILTGSDDRTARYWDLACGPGPSLSVKLQTGPDAYLVHASASRDGSRILLIGNTGNARVYDAATGKTVGPGIRFSKIGRGGAIHPDGTSFASLDDENRLSVWSVTSGLRLYTIPADDGEIVALAFSKDGSRLVTAGNVARVDGQPGSGLISIHEAKNGSRLLGPASVPAEIKGIAIDTELRWIACHDKHGVIEVRGAVDLAPPTERLEHLAGINQLIFSLDGMTLASAGMDGKARLWELPGGRLKATLAHDHGVNRIEFSPDGKLVATAGQDRAARIWDAADGTPLTRRMIHKSDVHSLGFNGDGHYLVTGSGGLYPGGGGELIAWETATGEPVTTPFTFQNAVKILQSMADGHSILAVTKDSLVAQTWTFPSSQTATADLLALAAVLSGHKISGEDGEARLSAKVLADEHRRLRLANPSYFEPTRDELLRWHDAEAASCEGQELWEQALIHLNVLVKAQPYARCALSRRANVLGELDRWEQARRDFERITADGSAEAVAWYQVQLLRSYLGDRAAYRSGCRELLRASNPLSELWERNAMAYACALEAAPERDHDLLLKLIEDFDRIPETDANFQEYQNTRAAVFFRVNRYEEAMAIFRSLKMLDETSQDSNTKLSSRLLLSMTLAKLGQVELARTQFATIAPLVEARIREGRDGKALEWFDRVHLQALVRENRVLLALDSGAMATEKSPSSKYAHAVLAPVDPKEVSTYP